MTNEQMSILITFVIVGAVWYVLNAIGMAGQFKKAGKKPATAFVPMLREKLMFEISWKNTKMGLVWLVCAVVGIVGVVLASYVNIQILGFIGLACLLFDVVLLIIRDTKQAKAFLGNGAVAIGLVFLNPFVNVYLGKNKEEYQGAK